MNKNVMNFYCFLDALFFKDVQEFYGLIDKNNVFNNICYIKSTIEYNNPFYKLYNRS
jgi:hypothetical protein